MKTLRTQEDLLFQRWQKESSIQHFIRDGIFDETSYNQTPVKTLFVLKDAYSDTSGKTVDLDIRDYGRDIAKGHTWGTLARWAYGIHHLNEKLDWEDIYKIGNYPEQRRQAVRGAGLMNLKKECSPQATTDKDALSRAAKRDKYLIQEQWQLYNPQVTICGSWQIFDPLCQALDIKRDEVFPVRGVKCAVYQKNHYIIQGCHPAAQYPSHMKYFMVRDVVAELYREINTK